VRVALRIATILLVFLALLFAIGQVLRHTIFSPERVFHYSHEMWEGLTRVRPGMSRTQVDQLLGKPTYLDDVSPHPGLILSEEIESRRDEVASYAEYWNGIDNMYIVAFDAQGLVVGKAYMCEGPLWDNKLGTIRTRPQEEGPLKQEAAPEAD